MVIVSDTKSRTDGPAAKMMEMVSSPIPIVLMARTHRYKFNEELLKLDKYILCEFSEHGWSFDLQESHRWGVNTDKFPHFEDEEYKRFDDWVASNPPVLTFTRELLKKDVTETHIPIDYPCWYATREIQSKLHFDCRPISSFYFWGRSHEARLILHSNIWKAASEKGFSVCDNLNFFDKFVMEENGDKWVSMWMPHYGRIDIKEILGRQALSKTSIALRGAGVKTFRHCESSLNSVMVKWEDDLAWSFPWDKSNCILTTEGNEIDDIRSALNQEDLYLTYLNGIATCQMYQIDNYVKHIEQQIKNVIA